MSGGGSGMLNAAAAQAAAAAAEAARLEAESIIVQLQEQVAALTQELDEERAESGKYYI